MARAYREREEVFAAVMTDRAEWDQATAGKRRLAVAADAELRRRHPGRWFEPLRSAEPEPVTAAGDGDLALGLDASEMSQWIKDLEVGHRAFAGQLAERQRAAQRDEPGLAGLRGAVAGWAGSGRQALLQPPQPQIPPSARVLERAMERQAGREAGS